MAIDKSTAKDLAVEERLNALYNLQLVASEIDKIRTLRGELPLEVQDLEDEIAGLETRAVNLEEEIKRLSDAIVAKKNEIKEADLSIKKYEGQQNTVRNNREFDAISKEIEYQNLEKQLCEKRIKEFTAEMKRKKELADESKEKVEERRADLEIKRAELEKIVSETKQDEDALLVKAEALSKNIDERMLTAFRRIRGNARNGLAVVTIQRDACGGCFNKIPPQRQLDIRLKKRIIVCEYCGRILYDNRVEEQPAETAEAIAE